MAATLGRQVEKDSPENREDLREEILEDLAAYESDPYGSDDEPEEPGPGSDEQAMFELRQNVAHARECQQSGRRYEPYHVRVKHCGQDIDVGMLPLGSFDEFGYVNESRRGCCGFSSACCFWFVFFLRVRCKGSACGFCFGLKLLVLGAKALELFLHDLLFTVRPDAFVLRVR